MNREQLEGSLLNQVSVINEGQTLPIFFGTNQVFVLDVQKTAEETNKLKPLGLANDTELIIEEPEMEMDTSVDTGLKNEPEIRTYVARHIDTCKNPFLEENLVLLMKEDEFDSLVRFPATSQTLEDQINWRSRIVPLELVDWESSVSTEIIIQSSKMGTNSKILINFREFESNVMALNIQANGTRISNHIANARRVRKFETKAPRSPSRMSLDVPFRIKNVATGFLVDSLPMELLCRLKLYIHEAMTLGVMSWVSLKDNLKLTLGEYSVQLALDSLSRNCYEMYTNLVAVSLPELYDTPILDSIDLSYLPRELLTPVSQFSVPLLERDLLTNTTNRVIKIKCIDDRDMDALSSALKYTLLTVHGMDYVCIDILKFIRRDSLQSRPTSISEMLDRIGTDLVMRSPTRRIFVMFKNLNALFKEDIAKEEQQTYAFMIESLKK